MNERTHLSREHFDQHIAEVFGYMKQTKEENDVTSNRGWESMTVTLVESLTEDHVGAFDLPDVFERAMERVWERIEYDHTNNPQDLVKTYYITEPINRSDESGPRIYVETFSFLSQDKWSLVTRIGLLTNNHSIGSTHIADDEEQRPKGWTAIDNKLQNKLDKDFPPISHNGAMNSFKETPMDVRQQGQFTAAMDEPTRAWRAYTDKGMSKGDRMARGKTSPMIERIEALEHDLTEIMAVLVSKDIMRNR